MTLFQYSEINAFFSLFEKFPQMIIYFNLTSFALGYIRAMGTSKYSVKFAHNNEEFDEGDEIRV